MKIKINKFETYEINYNKDEMEVQEFLIYMERLENIKKLLQRQTFSIPSQNENQPKIIYKKSEKREWCDTKEKALAIMQVFYLGSKEERIELGNLIGVLPADIQKGFFGLKTRFNIQSHEVGLKRWLQKGEGRVKENTKIPNFEQRKNFRLIFNKNENQTNGESQTEEENHIV